MLGSVSTKASPGRRKWSRSSMENVMPSGSRWGETHPSACQPQSRWPALEAQAMARCSWRTLLGRRLSIWSTNCWPTGEYKSTHLRNHLKHIRAQEKAKLQADPSKTLGDVTTVNLTIINGGVQTNVVPDKYSINLKHKSWPKTYLKVRVDLRHPNHANNRHCAVWKNYQVLGAKNQFVHLQLFSGSGWRRQGLAWNWKSRSSPTRPSRQQVFVTNTQIHKYTNTLIH